MYILLAQLIAQGKVPYHDFFHHQTPLYLYVLAPFVKNVEPLFWGRMLSILFYCCMGGFVLLFAKRFELDKTLVSSFFLFIALGVYGRLALPNGLMVLLATAGISLAVTVKNARWQILSALLMVLAILVKPLAISTALAVFFFFLVLKEKRLHLIYYTIAGATFSFLAILTLHFATDGFFTELVMRQLDRYQGRDAFAAMQYYVPFREYLIEAGISSAWQWNLHSHFSALFGYWFLNTNFYLMVLAIFGIYRLIKLKLKKEICLLALWLGLPLIFNFFVWEPVWDHYFLQYVPPLAILATYAFKEQRLSRQVISIIAIVYMAISITAMQLGSKKAFYRQVESFSAKKVSTFNPVVYAINGQWPPCGLFDPFNQFGDFIYKFWGDLPGFKEKHISRQKLLACLRNDQSIYIYIDSWALTFYDTPLAKSTLNLGGSRLIFADDRVKNKFLDLARKHNK